MSRLQQHRQQQTNSKIIKLIVISIVLMAILFFGGLQSIINGTVFVNNLIRGNPTQTQEADTIDSDFYGIINLDEPEIATNSASLIVTGDATEFKTIELYINNVKVETTTVSSNGTFNKEIGKLREGENKIHAVAKTQDSKQKKQSDSYSVTYIKEPPELEIETPKDNDKTSKNEIQIKGKTDKDVDVRINNQPVVVDSEGNFTSNYRLKEGENKLEFTATDIAGNVEKKEIKVIYEKD